MKTMMAGRQWGMQQGHMFTSKLSLYLKFINRNYRLLYLWDLRTLSVCFSAMSSAEKDCKKKGIIPLKKAIKLLNSFKLLFLNDLVSYNLHTHKMCFATTEQECRS